MAGTIGRNGRRTMRAFVLLMMIFALPAMVHAGEQCEPHESVAEIVADPGNSLRGPLSIEELEKENSIVIRETGQALPFGYGNKAWLEMKAAMQPGDQIYFLSYRDGTFYVDYHVLVRDGCIIRRLMGRIT
jgi:hypothetical protein